MTSTPPTAARAIFRAAETYGRMFGKIRGRDVDISAEQLMEQACRDTGLLDFGRSYFRDGLSAITKAYDEEGELSWVGRVAVRRRISLALRTRLLVTNELFSRRSTPLPPMRQPIVIASLPRTGTTFLQRLLAQDPKARWLATWEAIFPARARSDVEAGRDRRTRGLWKLRLAHSLARRAFPSYQAIHPVGIDEPEEELMLLENSFVSDFVMLPSYRRWYLSSADSLLSDAYVELIEQLQLVARLRQRGERWLLKSPSHLYGLRHLLDQLPNAVVVQVHREPVEVWASMSSMAKASRAVIAPARLASVQGDCAAWMASALTRAGTVRSSAREGQFIDVHYQRLVADPVGVVRSIYETAGYEFTPEFESGLVAWLARNNPSQRQPHTYASVPADAESTVEVDAIFASYRDRFGLPPRGADPKDS